MALSDWISESPMAATPAALATHRAVSSPKTGKSPGTVASAATTEAKDEDFTEAEWVEMEKLIRDLAQLESWEPKELAQVLDQRSRMAAVNVRRALARLRASMKSSLAPWPNRPEKRSKVVLCVLDGGKP